MIKGACEFLKEYEIINPLQSHADYYKKWSEDAIELWTIQVSEDIEDLETVLKVRKALMEQCSSHHTESSDWKWLITVKQIEQRSEEWYNETLNIITASEISQIWKGVRSRASLIVSKLETKTSMNKRNAVKRGQTGPMDWGVRYEPVVKQILEDTLGAKIQELGRIRHRTCAKIAASPDGLFIECNKYPELVGTLVEIKCPPTRVINDKIPYDYWCQMQLQMEVCDRPSCEFVEVKFKELGDDEVPTEDSTHGWISLIENSDTLELRYEYSENPVLEGGWVCIEKYQWELVKLRRVTVPRDATWFKNIQGDLAAFWKDVEDARAGIWQAPPPRPKKEKESSCAIVNSDSEKVVGEVPVILET